MNITLQFINLAKISSPSGNETAMSLYLQAWLKTHNFESQIDSVGSIYAKNNKEGVPLLLCAHMDTVQPGENIHPIIKNGVIKSDGKTILGADNKAALAAILTAVEKMEPKRNLELLFTVKEEIGGGIEHFPFKWIKSKQALIFDSAKPLGGIVLRSPNIHNFDIQFMGKSAHASVPETGINAFTPAFQVLSTLPVGSLDNGETTINIGLIEGGTGINTVPNYIHIQGEVRSYDKVLFNKHLDTIQETVKKYAKKYHTDVAFKLNGYCAGYIHEKKNPFFRSLSAIFSTVGIKTTFHTYSGISDANILNSKGIKTFNLTDGVKNPHTTKERIKVKDLNKLSEIIKKCITEL